MDLTRREGWDLEGIFYRYMSQNRLTNNVIITVTRKFSTLQTLSKTEEREAFSLKQLVHFVNQVFRVIVWYYLIIEHVRYGPLP